MIEVFRSEKEAIKLLKKYSLSKSRVEVMRIAEDEGINVLEQDLESDISGILVIREGRAAIGYNRLHHSNRQRFTVAHELGHYVLHRHLRDLFIDDTLTFYRDEASSEGEYLQEIQANSFAAELLMPRGMLKEILTTQKIDIHDQDNISSLASKFGVSEQSLTYRLINLKFIAG